MTQHRELCCIQLPVLLAFTAWRLMRSISSVIDCQRSGSSPPVTVTGLIWDSCTSLPKGAGRPQWLQLMICGKYLMLARWSGDILDTQPWIMDPSRDEARAEVSKAPNEFPRWLPRSFPKRGEHNRGLNMTVAQEALKDEYSDVKLGGRALYDLEETLCWCQASYEAILQALSLFLFFLFSNLFPPKTTHYQITPSKHPQN